VYTVPEIASSSLAVASCDVRGHSAISPAPANTGGPVGLWTVMTDVPTAPSLVAVTLAVPAARPTTKPVEFTDAMAGALLAQVTTRPPSGLPLASLGVAVNWTVPFTWIVAAAGLTSTAATGTGVTVTVAVPFLPSLVAVIVADPAARPWTSPFPSTLATPGALLCHVTVRPLSGFPLASFGVAVSWTKPPTWMLEVAGATATDATGIWVTVTADVPFFPSLVAVMVTGPPTALPVTRPVASTVAIVASPVCQVTVRPLSGFPAESFGVAVSWSVAPTGMVAVEGLTSTEATGTGVTVTADVPFLPSLVAVMVTGPPRAFPVTRPLASTLAMAVSPLAQVTVRPVSGLPAESFGVAVSWSVTPTWVLPVAGVTTTDATGTGVTVTADVPLLPSLVAVMVTGPPGVFPVTRPFASTLAMVVSPLAQVRTRPLSGLPAASFGVAVSCTVPLGCIAADVGLTSTEATAT